MTFPEALEKSGVRFRNGNSGKIHLCCPFCAERGKGADDKFRLCVHAVQGWGKCVHCDWKRKTAVRAVLLKLSVRIAVSGFSIEEPEKDAVVRLPADFQILSEAHDELDRTALQYLLDRGISPQQINRNRIGVSYIGPLAYRVIFPVYDARVLVGIVARDFTGRGKPKYLNSIGKKRLYNFNPLNPNLVLSEGVFKALRIERVTEACSAALLGRDLTDDQLEQVKNSACRRVVIYYDPDVAGRRGAISVAEKLRAGWGGTVEVVKRVVVPADEDGFKNLRSNLLKVDPWSWKTRTNLQLYTP